ncbi:MAG: 6,7-dimethyl-8-ribityllumazine synthase [Blastocatellia bacterium]
MSELKPKIVRGNLDASRLRVAIVVSRWNDLLTSQLLRGALRGLEGCGAGEDQLEVLEVPGALELPLATLRAAESGRFDAVIALGVVIRGETPHFEFVAGQAASGIASASLSSRTPIAFGVVTADTVEQATNRCGLKSGNKGYEAALAAIEMANLLKAADLAGAGQQKEKAFPHVV